MDCPRCGYKMSPYERECPRCRVASRFGAGSGGRARLLVGSSILLIMLLFAAIMMTVSFISVRRSPADTPAREKTVGVTPSTTDPETVPPAIVPTATAETPPADVLPAPVLPVDSTPAPVAEPPAATPPKPKLALVGMRESDAYYVPGKLVMAPAQEKNRFVFLQLEVNDPGAAMKSIDWRADFRVCKPNGSPYTTAGTRAYTLAAPTNDLAERKPLGGIAITEYDAVTPANVSTALQSTWVTGAPIRGACIPAARNSRPDDCRVFLIIDATRQELLALALRFRNLPPVPFASVSIAPPASEERASVPGLNGRFWSAPTALIHGEVSCLAGDRYTLTPEVDRVIAAKNGEISIPYRWALNDGQQPLEHLYLFTGCQAQGIEGRVQYTQAFDRIAVPPGAREGRGQFICDSHQLDGSGYIVLMLTGSEETSRQGESNLVKMMARF